MAKATQLKSGKISITGLTGEEYARIMEGLEAQRKRFAYAPIPEKNGAEVGDKLAATARKYGDLFNNLEI